MVAVRPRVRRWQWVVALVGVVVVGIGAVGVVGWESRADFRIAFLVDTSSAEASAAVAGAVGAAVQNTGDDDALSLRRFGGRCGDPHNTAQLVGPGTGHAARISRSVRGLTTGGSATLQSGILAAIKDFSGRYPFRGKKSNRIIVITGRGTDACDHDQTAVTKTLREKVKAAGLDLDFRFVGYLTPTGEQANLTQLASAVKASPPEFPRTPADLTTTLKHLVIPKPLEAEPLKTPVLAADVQRCATRNATVVGTLGPVPASVRLPAMVQRPSGTSVYGASFFTRKGYAPYYAVGPADKSCKAFYSVDGHEILLIGSQSNGIVYQVPGGAVEGPALACQFFPGIARYIHRTEPTVETCKSAPPPDGQTASQILAGSDGLYASFVQNPSGRSLRPPGKPGDPWVELIVAYLGKHGLETVEYVYCTLPSAQAKTCAAELQYFLSQSVSRLNASVSVSSDVYPRIGALVDQAMR